MYLEFSVIDDPKWKHISFTIKVERMKTTAEKWCSEVDARMCLDWKLPELQNIIAQVPRPSFALLIWRDDV